MPVAVFWISRQIASLQSSMMIMQLGLVQGKGLSITLDGGRTFRNYSDFNEGLSDTQVYSIFKSDDSTFWVGFINGLVQARASIVTPISRNNSNILSNTVNGVFVSNDGTLWLATDAGVSFQEPRQPKILHT